MSVFVLEIGTEELPARFQGPLEAELRDRFTAGLNAAGLESGKLAAYCTPRRAVLYIEGLAGKSRESEDLVTGPPVKAALDAAGKLTRAGEGFAKTQGVDLAELFTTKTGKGEYLAVRKKTGGETAAAILGRLCPEVICALAFPKRMRWGNGGFSFARPLRWLLALLDEAVLPFAVGGVKSGRQTRGHRVHGPGPFELDKADNYFALMRERGQVIVDPAERRRRIIEGGDALAAEMGGQVLWKDGLLDEVQGLCEHPVPLLGSFDASFLEVPPQVLLTSMESHQKSFGLISLKNGALLPNFLTVLNLRPPDESLVRKGWERVLRARLEDARFFWKSDLAAGFDAWLDKLDKVIFMNRLGSLGDKTRRLSALCGWLAGEFAGQAAGGELEQALAERAGRLAKADLVTDMVGEFDSLQGIMGGIYAARQGESPLVAEALAQQYLPAGPDSALPASLPGAVLSLADKADTLAGCFGLGLIPTGAADPFALRRCALGIARILEEKKLRLDVRRLFRKALELYGDKEWKLKPDEALAALNEFFSLRLKNLFMAQGAETLLVEGALAADYSDVWAASARLAALRRFSAGADFASSVLTFKRAANIIRKQGQGERLDGRFKAELLREAAE
ncbi:MAG: glycine--tRNA ligase subunit beta, partial [Deltaproteobacteria bacterium]|nr:glycine--tRNA ligase subunit beta [Deltaproteobacteria bacterium]